MKTFRNITFLFVTLSLMLPSCQGTHGKIKRYRISGSLDKFEQVLFFFDSTDNKMVYIQNTDRSGAKRMEYFDIHLITSNDSIRYTIRYEGDKVEIIKEKRKSFNIFIVYINGNMDDEFPIFSQEKARCLEIFEDYMTKKLAEKGIAMEEDDN